MTRHIQKSNEKRFLELFLKIKSYNYRITDTDNEPPDFTLTNNFTNDSIGVELSEFFNDYSQKGSSTQREQSHLDKTIKSLNDFVMEKYSELNLTFTLTYKHTNDKIIDFGFEDIKLKIIEFEPFINNRGVNNTKTKNFEQIWYEKLNLDTSVRTVAITDYNSIDENSIVSIIKKKTTLQKNWSSKYSEKWLLIHSGHSFSNIHNIPTKFEFNYEEFKMDWNKIYFMSPTSNEIVELLSL
jgi:hypothetical protein